MVLASDLKIKVEHEFCRSSPLRITDPRARPSVLETSSDDLSVKEQVVIKDEKREVEEEEMEEEDIRDKIRNAFGDDSDSD